MAEPLQESVPLRTDDDGVLRVGGTRVPLETVVSAFEAGSTPEEILQDFPVLRLDDIYAVLTYYLRHTAEVRVYLDRREALSEEMRRKWEARAPQADLRQRLLARQGG